MIQYSSSYDYPPYEIQLDGSNSPRAFEIPSTEEEIDLLMQSAPFRVYQFSAINAEILLHHADHPMLDGSWTRSRSRSSMAIRSQPLDSLPGVLLKLECLDGQFSHPMYPKRLSTVAAGMAQPSPSLLKNCQSQLTAKVINLSSHLFYTGQSKTLLMPNTYQFSMKDILLPEVFKNPTLVLKSISVEMHQTKFRVTRPQVFAMTQILSSYSDSAPKPLKLVESSLLEDSLTKKMSSFVVSIEGTKMQFDTSERTRTLQATLESLSVNLSSVLKDGTSAVIPILSRH